MNARTQTRQPEATRRKLIEATMGLMLRRGFNATTVDQICAEAGVTKGSFFHHFHSKDDIGQAAIKAWGEFGQSIYAEAWKQPAGPLEEIHRLFDIMDGLTRRDQPCACMIGMLTQEMSGAHPDFRAACGRELGFWMEMVRSRLQAAKEQLKPAANFDPAEVAWFLSSVWQGSMLVAKTRQSQEMIRSNLKIARAYVDSLFSDAKKPE
jgi:TetR/AcrR family transcriptional regulator, transcriptional repressor for nem operon